MKSRVDTVVGSMRTFPSPDLRAARHPWTVAPGTLRLDIARGLGVLALAAYNWWVVVPFEHGMMRTSNGFFSDLSATGQPHAALLQHLDLSAGILLFAALLVRGPIGTDGRRTEWRWLLAFAVAGAVGGRYPYACAEGLSASCRTLERHLQLPFHHYVHMIAGIAEFATITVAVVLARRRTKGTATRVERLHRGILRTFLVSYPLLAVAYLTDRGGAFVEPIFFVAFSLVVIAELFESASPEAARANRSSGASGLDRAPAR